jgi:hypothetical protein
MGQLCKYYGCGSRNASQPVSGIWTLSSERRQGLFVCVPAGQVRAMCMRNQSVGLVLVLFSGLVLGPGTVGAQPEGPDTLWTYTYASPVNDAAYTIAPTPDGGFVVGGEGRAPDSANGALLIRLDNEGHQVWVRRYEEFSSGINSVDTTVECGLAMTGGCSTGSGIEIVKADSDGVVQWSRCIPTSIYGEPGWSIVGSSDGGIAVLGVDPLFAHYDIFLVHLSANGDSLWTQTFGSPSSYKAGAVLATADGGFLVGSSEHGQAYIAKVDGDGAVQWNANFGNASPDTEELVNALDLTAGDDYLVAGTQTRGFFTVNPYAARLTSTGDTLWTRAYPDLGPAWFYSVHELPTGEIAFGGSTGGSFLAVLWDAAGGPIWSRLYGTPVEEHGRAMCLALDGGLALAGYQRQSHATPDDIWVVCTRPVGLAGVTPWVPFTGLQLLPNYPNPFNPSTFIRFILDRPGVVTVSVYDVTGRQIARLFDGHLTPGFHEFPFGDNTLASGSYFYTVQSPTLTLSGRMVLVR